MMRFVTSIEEFNSLRGLSNSFFNSSKSLPANIFNGLYSLYLFITFDEVHMKLFFRHLKGFLKKTGETKFIYLVLDPSPEDYGCDQTGKYKAIEFSVEDSEDEFIAALNEYSGGDEPDCIMDNSDQILVMSDSKNWCVYANRDDDIAVCAFSDQGHYNVFQTIYGKDLLPGAVAAAKYAYGEGSNYEIFIKSYSPE